MPIDASIYGITESPLSQLAKIRQTAFAQQQQEQQQKLLPLQLQAAKDEATQRQQTLEQGRRTMASQDALNQAYQGAITKDAEGNPTIDVQKVTEYLGQNGQGHQVPAVLKSISDAQNALIEKKQKLATINKTNQEIQGLQRDARGSLGLAVRQAGNDPNAAMGIIALAHAHGDLSDQEAHDLVAHIQQNPTTQFVASLVDPLIAASPKAQESIKNASQGDAAAANAKKTLELLPGEKANQALQTTELTQKTTGTVPITPEQKIQNATAKQSADAATSNAATTRTRLERETGPEAAQGWVDSIKADPDTWKSVPAQLKNQVGMLWQKTTGLPVPREISAEMKNQEFGSQVALSHISNLRQLLADPDVKNSVGPIAGRIAKGETGLGTTLSSNPVVAQKQQQLLTAMEYLFVREGKALFGGRPPERLMQDLKKVSVNPAMNMNLLKGSLDAAQGSAERTIETAQRYRFNGKLPTQNAPAPATNGKRPSLDEIFK